VNFTRCTSVFRSTNLNRTQRVYTPLETPISNDIREAHSNLRHILSAGHGEHRIRYLDGPQDSIHINRRDNPHLRMSRTPRLNTLDSSGRYRHTHRTANQRGRSLLLHRFLSFSLERRAACCWRDGQSPSIPGRP